MPAQETVALEDLAPWLRGLGDRLARLSWERPLRAIAVLLSADAKRNFEQGAGPDGAPWLPLKKPRANSKGGDKPLRDSGILMGSLAGRGLHHVERVTGSSLEWGTNADYAGLMNYGGTVHFPEKRRGKGQKPWVFPGPNGPVFTRKIKAHSVTIPARPFIGLSERVLGYIDRLLADEVERQLGFDPRGPSSPV